MASGTYVADADKLGALQVKPIWKTHYAILAALLLCVSVGAYVAGNKLRKWGPYPQLLADVRSIESLPQVQRAGVQDLIRSDFNGSRKRILIVNAFWSGKSSAEESFSNEVAKTILQQDPQVAQHDLLRIVLIRGYNLGIARSEVFKSFEHTPAEWNSLLFGTPPKTPAQL